MGRGGRADRDTSPAPGALHKTHTHTHTHWLPVLRTHTHTRAQYRSYTHLTTTTYTWLMVGKETIGKGGVGGGDGCGHSIEELGKGRRGNKMS